MTATCAELPSAWREMLTKPAAPPPPRAPRTTPVGADIFTAYNATADLAAMLHRDGATVGAVFTARARHGRLGGPCSTVTRPGKEARKGGSATLWYGQGGAPDRLYVFSTDWPGLPPSGGHGYSAVDYIAITRHGGDIKAARRAIAAEIGWVDKPSPLPATSPSPQPVGGDLPVTSDDWQPVQLGPIAREIRAGTRKRITPELVAVAGGVPLLYRSRLNQLFGESGGGKTWVALGMVRQVVLDGGRVLIVDYEDSADGIAGRLVDIGLTDEQIDAGIDYRHPDTSIGFGLQHLAEHPAGSFDLVVLDSTGEAMGPDGVESNSDDQVARWFAMVKRFHSLPGAPAILAIDHVPKATEKGATAYAIGSQRKRAAVTGVAYRVDAVTEPAIGRDGELRLTVAKDRGGSRPKGSVACAVTVRSLAGGAVEMAFEAPARGDQNDGEKGPLRDGALMELVSQYLTAARIPVRHSTLHNMLGRRKSDVIKALRHLEVEGCVTKEVVTEGGYSSYFWRSLRPWSNVAVPSVPAVPAVPKPFRERRTPQTAHPRSPKGERGAGNGSPECLIDDIRSRNGCEADRGEASPLTATPDPFAADDPAPFADPFADPFA